MGRTLLSVMPKRRIRNTIEGTVTSAEVTCASHLALICAFYVCGLCAANRANGDPETERGARTSNQVCDAVPGPPLPEGATAHVGGLHRRSSRTQQRRVPLRASPIAAERATAQTQEWWQRRLTHVPTASAGLRAPACYPLRIVLPSPKFLRVLRADACSLYGESFLSLHPPTQSQGWFLP